MWPQSERKYIEALFTYIKKYRLLSVVLNPRNNSEKSEKEKRKETDYLPSLRMVTKLISDITCQIRFLMVILPKNSKRNLKI